MPLTALKLAKQHASRSTFAEIRPAMSRQGPVNLPPEAAGLRQAMRKMHSYMWLEDAIADDNAAQDARAHQMLLQAPTCTQQQPSPVCRPIV